MEDAAVPAADAAAATAAVPAVTGHSRCDDREVMGGSGTTPVAAAAAAGAGSGGLDCVDSSSQVGRVPAARPPTDRKEMSLAKTLHVAAEVLHILRPLLYVLAIRASSRAARSAAGSAGLRRPAFELGPLPGQPRKQWLWRWLKWYPWLLSLTLDITSLLLHIAAERVGEGTAVKGEGRRAGEGVAREGGEAEEGRGPGGREGSRVESGAAGSHVEDEGGDAKRTGGDAREELAVTGADVADGGEAAVGGAASDAARPAAAAAAAVERRNRSEDFQLTEEERAELARRRMLLVMYLLRSPCFDTVTRTPLEGLATALKPIPLLGMLAARGYDLLLGIQSVYFYTAAS
eukprot:TRINITY_DN13949_c0_g4_i1.p1 TRINITY_DN13949_c0_g4~~TRINITY_DN13949_c0_g4_i1.p1  ORF type:complete len:360 (+),score=-6.05 TRINITY_DN13949_c0_g4_i1:41-1081(+)